MKFGSFRLIAKTLVASLEFKRKMQASLLVVLQFCSGISEFISISAVVPVIYSFMEDGNVFSLDAFQRLERIFPMAEDNIHFFALLFFAIVFIVSNILRVLTKWLELKFIASLGTDLTRLAFGCIMSKPYETIVQNNSSIWYGNLTNDVNESVSFLQSILFCIHGLIISCFVVSAILLINPSASAWMGGSICITYMILVLLLRGLLQKNGALISQSFATRTKVIQEALTSVSAIVLGSHLAHYSGYLIKADQINRSKRASNQILASAPRYFIEVIGVLTGIVFVILSEMGDIPIQQTLVTLVVFALAGTRLLPIFQQIYICLNTLFSSFHPTMKVVRLLESDFHLKEKPDSKNLNSFNQLTLSDLSFSFQGNPKKLVLSDVNLKFKKEEFIVITGKTGSGKSTLLNVMLGLLQPKQGKILVDERAIEGFAIHSWQASIALVPQNVFLIDDTIRANIAFGVKDSMIDCKKLENCIKTSCLEEFISSLPQGLETRVGEFGTEISGGERQRIGIARALYYSPKVLFLDESTSSLDIATERELLGNLKNLKNKMTIVMIAHRAESILAADKVLVMGNGRIKRELDKSELAANIEILEEI